MNIYKRLFFLIACIFFLTNAGATEANRKKRNDSLFVPHKNVLAIRIGAPVLDLITIAKSTNKSMGITYERVLLPKHSISAGVDYYYLFADYDKGYEQDFGPNNEIYEYAERYREYRQRIELKPGYRFYLNRKKIYPRGVFIGVTTLLGYENADIKYSYRDVSHNGSPGMDPRSVKYAFFNYGIGPDIGVQYFLGKRKRLMMSHKFSAYFCNSWAIPVKGLTAKRFMANLKYGDWVGDTWWTLGYTFGKAKN